MLTGLVGTGGAIRALALVPFGLNPLSFVATSTLIDAAGDYVRLGVYIRKGYFDREHLFYLPALALAAWIGSWLGKRSVERMNPLRFRRLVFWFIFLMGCFSLLPFRSVSADSF